MSLWLKKKSKYTDAQKKAILKYAKNNLKRIPLDVQLSKYEEIKAAAASRQETVNGFIKKAIDARLLEAPEQESSKF